MRFIAIFVLLTWFSFQTNAQKLEPSNPGWLTNMNDAYEMSKKTGKPILANFTGSDWCGWCKKLTASVFSQPDFQKWANENVILLELDFPRGKSLPENIRLQNDNMRNALGVRGYPSVYLLDLVKDDKTNSYAINNYGRTGYKASVDEFTTDIKGFMAQKSNTK